MSRLRFVAAPAQSWADCGGLARGSAGWASGFGLPGVEKPTVLEFHKGFKLISIDSYCAEPVVFPDCNIDGRTSKSVDEHQRIHHFSG